MDADLDRRRAVAKIVARAWRDVFRRVQRPILDRRGLIADPGHVRRQLLAARASLERALAALDAPPPDDTMTYVAGQRVPARGILPGRN